MIAGLWLCPRNKPTVIPVEESSFCHPRVLKQMKSDFKSMLSVYLNSDAFLQKEFFLQQFCIWILRVFVEAVGRKCLTGGVHRTGFCFMTTRHTSWIHSFFQCLTKKKNCWCYLAFVLLHPSLHGLFWFSKIEAWLKGWRFKDIMKSKLNRRQHWSASQNRSFKGCFQLWESHWVMCLNLEGDPFEWDSTKL